MKRLVIAAFVLALSGSASAQLPAGHPTADPVAQNVDPPGLFRAPPDESDEDATLPTGTILVQLRNADNEPVSGAKVSLGILKSSIAKGDSREHQEQTTDAKGYVRFDGLSSGSGIAYRITNVSNGGTFAATPFQLPEGKGMRVVLHVYQVTADVSHEQFFESAGALYLELKDDRLLVQQALRIFNATRFAWVPQDMILKLPEGFTALQSGQAMSDQGVDSVEGGARLRGTFPPGEHEVVFSWQLPYSGSKDIGFEIISPPRMGSMVVRAAAAQGMLLNVDGFPPAMNQQNEEGQRMLVTAKRVGESDPPIPRVHVVLSEIPTRGPAALLTTIVALLAIATGLYVGTRKRAATTKEQRTSDRDRILDELEELERARKAGDIGPKTYERARRALIEDIAQTFAREAAAAPKKKKPSATAKKPAAAT
ncbi:hypothetical protein BH09MYX1_BH09MYX1_17500 [soil metagenome]